MDTNCYEALVRSLLDLNKYQKDESEKIINELKQKIVLMELQLQQFQFSHMSRMKVQRENSLKFYSNQIDRKVGQDTVDDDGDDTMDG